MVGLLTTRKLALRQLDEASGWMGYAFLAEQRAAGMIPSTKFSAPGFQVKRIMVDYLHTMDLGVAAD